MTLEEIESIPVKLDSLILAHNKIKKQACAITCNRCIRVRMKCQSATHVVERCILASSRKTLHVQNARMLEYGAAKAAKENQGNTNAQHAVMRATSQLITLKKFFKITFWCSESNVIMASTSSLSATVSLDITDRTFCGSISAMLSIDPILYAYMYSPTSLKINEGASFSRSRIPSRIILPF